MTSPAARPVGVPSNGLPLANVRVLDLSRIWAGPYCTKLMADMGAQVIKVESLQVYDSHRGPVNPAPGIASYPDSDGGDQPWNRNGWFNCLHMSKYGITLDLTDLLGCELFEVLVSISDVLIENFRYGSLERLGYAYEDLRKLRPDLIYASMPGFGNSGPWRDYLAYGIGQEQLSGMAHMTGYQDDGPMKSGINHGDPITGSHAAGVILAALRHRRRTGKGMFIDVSQLESTVSLIGSNLLAYQMTGEEYQLRGNRSELYAPHNVYLCCEEDSWVSIAVTGDAEWRALCKAMDQAALAEDDRYRSLEGRKTHEDELDAIIAAWTSKNYAREVANLLQRVGVAASPVLSAPGLLADPHMEERGTFVSVEHPWAGTHIYPGIPWRMSATPGRVRWSAPGLGQDNNTVYGEVLGLSDERIQELLDHGVIGTIPTDSRII